MSEEHEKAQNGQTTSEMKGTPTNAEIVLREISEEGLSNVIEEHGKWLDSEGKPIREGKRADLSETNLNGRNLTDINLVEGDLRLADLQRANLTGANLIRADLRSANFEQANLSWAKLQDTECLWANFRKALLGNADLKGAILHDVNFQRARLQNANLGEADLRGADLQGAILSSANLQNTHLLKAKLREANLQDADLKGAKGLSSEQLAGANVSGAKLPGDISKFEGLKTVEDLSRNAKRIFQIMLLGCVYSLLTIAMTTDAKLLTNSASSSLPIIQTAIPIAWFFIVAPIVLFSIYLYFHLYLQRLWENLADLPAIFPDGKSIDKKASQWLPTGIVRSHFKLLRSTRPTFSGLQSLIAITLAWFVVPLTTFIFWLRYLRRHDLIGTVIHIVILIASILFAALFYTFARATLRLERVNRKGHRITTILLILWSGVVSFYSYEAIYSSIPYPLFPPLEFKIRANLREADVSIKPDLWTGSETVLVKGASLRGRNLRNADAYRAFLVNADLGDADLQEADLTRADLRGANLLNANLSYANLSVANLLGARLQDANLIGADIHGAELLNVDLQGANVKWANFKGAENLEVSQLSVAKNYQMAFYDDNFLNKNGIQLGLPLSEEEHTKNVRTKLGEPAK